MTEHPNTADIYVLGSLIDFLSGSERSGHRPVRFSLHPAAKDLVEALGVPHVEIFALKVNNQFTTLDYQVQDRDILRVYPMEMVEKLDREILLRDPDEIPGRFIADRHLGKLTRLLRLVGIDTIRDERWDDAEIVKRAVAMSRTVLTRDLELLKHGALEHGYLPRSVDPEEQAREVFRYFDLQDRAAPFTRCMVCNGELQNAHPEQVAERVPEKVRQWCNAYRECQQCGNVYWKGSHYEKLKMQVNRLLH